MLNEHLKNNKIWYILILFFLVVFIVRSFFLDYYRLPSNSMLPTLKDGNYIIVDKSAISLGSCLITKNLINTGAKKGEIWVFNKPMWEISANNNAPFKGLEYVKRCAGEPGQTVYINKPSLEFLSSGDNVEEVKTHNIKIYPHDSTYFWSINRFGPLWIPKRNSIIPLNLNNIKLYGVIINHEGNEISIKKEGIFLNGKQSSTYKFKSNYYFMLGDNFYKSEDSRFWGLVPESNLIGKVIFIL